MYCLTTERGRTARRDEDGEEWRSDIIAGGEEVKMIEGTRWRVEGEMKRDWRKQEKMKDKG